MIGNVVWALFVLVVLGVVVVGVEVNGGPSLFEAIRAGWGVVKDALRSVGDLLRQLERALVQAGAGR